MFDVIIAGGGPGGASAAYTLNQAGLKTLVIEKERLPRYKACGGGLSPLMLQKYFPFSFEPVIDCYAPSVWYSYWGLDVEIPLPEKALAFVMRSRFDAFLLEHSHAEVRDGETVENVIERDDRVIVETRSGKSYEAAYLIGADGANSRVAKVLNLRQKHQTIFAIEVETQASPNVLQRFGRSPVFFLSGAGIGYTWIFPKSDHLSVGIGMFDPPKGQLKTRLVKKMKKYGISIENETLHGHTIPFNWGYRPRVGKRTLLVGDAAGLADPLSGEGIRLAIKSGRLAAESILQGDLSQYPRQVSRRIGRSHWLARPLLGLFFALPPLCFIFGACNPLASQAFMDVLADRDGYGTLWLRIFGSLPLYLGAEFLSAALPGREEAICKSIYGVQGPRVNIG